MAHGQVHPSRLLTLAQARTRTGLDLVAGYDVRSPITRLTYDAMERDAESAPHQLMRELGQHFFVSYGYDIFPHGVGVDGNPCLADFLALRDDRIIFVEAFSDAALSPQRVAAKRSLENFGEMAFLVMAGARRTQHPGTWAAKCALAAACDTISIHCGPAICGRCEALTPFPRYAFDLSPSCGAVPLIVAPTPRHRDDERMRIALRWGAEPYTEPHDLPIFSWPPRAIDHYARLQALLADRLRSAYSWRATSELPHRTWFALGADRRNIATISTDHNGLEVSARANAGIQFLDALADVGRRYRLGLIWVEGP